MGLFIGLGCGALFLLGGVVSAGAYFYLQSRQEERSEAIGKAVEASGKGQSTSGSASGGACKRAKRCCEAFAAKAGSVASHCAAYDNPLISDDACTQALDGFKKGASAIGVTCD